MENIARLLLLIILSFLLNCKSPEGPVFLFYKNLGNLKEIAPYIHSKQKFIVYTFSQYNHIFKENALGELILLEKTYKENQIIVSKLYFILRNLSYDRNRHIRIRTYKGIAFYDANTKFLDLHSENCYTYAKRRVDDRLYPIEGWSCDHLVWIFKNEPPFLIPIKDEEILAKQKINRTQYSQWLFISNPKQYDYFLFKSPVWFGTFLEQTEEGLVFYGYNADVYFNEKDILFTYKKNSPLKIKKIIGDFVIVDKKNLSDSEISQDLVIYSIIKE